MSKRKFSFEQNFNENKKIKFISNDITINSLEKHIIYLNNKISKLQLDIYKIKNEKKNKIFSLKQKSEIKEQDNKFMSYIN